MASANYRQMAAVTVMLLGLFCALAGRAFAAGPVEARQDYFVSADTVIIGCTAGAAAGALAGSLPVFAALMSGVGFPASLHMLINLTGLGCGVGAASGGVAILTAWMLDRAAAQPQTQGKAAGPAATTH